MPARQKNLFDYFDMSDVRKRYGRTQHGGAGTKGHRKEARPLSTKKWIHLTLKSHRATGRLSFLTANNRVMVKSILDEKAKRFGVRIADYANVGSHLHLKIKIRDRWLLAKFLKSVTTLIARKVSGAKKGKPFGKFWQGLAYTRVLISRLEELNLKGYIEANRLQAEQSPKARDEYLKAFNDWVYRERRRQRRSSA